MLLRKNDNGKRRINESIFVIDLLSNNKYRVDLPSKFRLLLPFFLIYQIMFFSQHTHIQWKQGRNITAMEYCKLSNIGIGTKISSFIILSRSAEVIKVYRIAQFIMKSDGCCCRAMLCCYYKIPTNIYTMKTLPSFIFPAPI